MRIEHIHAFLAVAKAGSFTRAGEELYLSQPTISRYIGELEAELGVPLFDRGKRSCTLTAAGNGVYPHALRIANEWEHMANEARVASEGTRIRLRIGYSFNEMLPMISLALSRDEIVRTNIDLSMRFGEGEALAQMVRDGELDCAVMHRPSLTHAQQLRMQTIRECSMGILVHRDSPLARFDEVRVEDLAGQTDIRINAEAPFYRAADDAFRRKGVEPLKHIFVGNSDECRPMMVTTGFFCLTPMIYSAWQDGKLIPVTDWPVPYPLVFVTSGEGAPITDSLFRILKDAL